MNKITYIICLIIITVHLLSCDNKKELLKKAETYDSLGETDSAIVFLKEYLLSQPTDLIARLELVNFYNKVQEYEKAKIICKTKL